MNAKSFGFPLGRGRWLDVELADTPAGPRWLYQQNGFTNPAVEWPEIISVGLSRLARFGGLTPKFYSVALHSVYLADYCASHGVSLDGQLLALLHDAPECLGVGDQNTFLKDAIGETIRAYENAMVEHILIELGICPTEEDRRLVHLYDKQLGASEARRLNMSPGRPWAIETDAEMYKWLERHPLDDVRDTLTAYEWRLRYHTTMRQVSYARYYASL